MTEAVRPDLVRLRAATSGDQGAIRGLIYRARINPRGLDWRRFVLAVDDGGRLVGCGQLKPHKDGSRELASIAVEPAWRGQGVASRIVRQRMQAGPPLWLVCRAELTPFYTRFGFRPVLPEEMAPAHFRRLLRFGRWLNRVSPPEHWVQVMVWAG